MGLSNDERGWVMTSLSGVACVLGASVICVDIIIRQFPGKKDFKIQDSDSFLSSSLSLSFGVMLFSSLFSMLPSSKASLVNSGYDPKTATWIMMACFLAGYTGIQVVSRALHKFIPSHVVDCEHTHEESNSNPPKEHNHANGHHNHDHTSHPSPQTQKPRVTRPRSRTKSSLPGHLPQQSLPATRSRQSGYFGTRPSGDFPPTAEAEAIQPPMSEAPAKLRTLDTASTRPPFHQRITSRLSRLTSAQVDECGSDGPCRGYTDLCNSECFKNVNTRGGIKLPPRGSIRRMRSVPGFTDENTPLLAAEVISTSALRSADEHNREPRSHPLVDEHGTGDINNDHDHNHEDDDAEAGFHHHHVPTNAFLSIGLQTSIAIALHKLPEGFITYATNHANPQLGVSVFLALFIHNITEGFAMALPLYLAINSRMKAMFWSFVLGGLSQPLGAGIAALWFAVAGNGKWAPDEGVYGGMFAVTAGIMVSVALQLFSEALELTHSRTLCMVGAILGMSILGVSSALTAR